MGILLFLIFGIIVGAVARWIVPGEGPGGILGDLIVGVIGAFIGGWLSSLLFHTTFGSWSISGFIMAVIGAVVLLFIVRAVSGRRTVA